MDIIISLTDIMAFIHIMRLVYIQLDFKPADIKHSSLCTMAKHVLRAMLPGNYEVFKKSFAEGTRFCQDIWNFYLHDADTVRQSWMARRSLIFTGQFLSMPWRDRLLSCSIQANGTLLSSRDDPGKSLHYFSSRDDPTCIMKIMAIIAVICHWLAKNELV